MILVGRYLSPFTRRVAVSMRLLGFPYEHNPLSTQADRDAIRAVNPLCRVPALILDGGETLIDSAAILDHLDELAGPGRTLLPAGGADRRRALKLVALAMGAGEKAVSAYYERVRRPPEKQYQGWVDECEAQIDGGFAEIEAMAGDGWLVGERITEADITVVAMLGFVAKMLPEFMAGHSYPRLAALVERCEALPAFAETRP